MKNNSAQPNLAKYQERQRSLPTSTGKTKSPSPPSSSEPERKRSKARTVSVEPIEQATSPLPDLPNDLKQKQEEISTAAQLNGRPRTGSPKQKTASIENSLPRKADAVMFEGLQDPLEIIRLIRNNHKLGFLYLTPAVDHSSIYYNPYNLK